MAIAGPDNEPRFSADNASSAAAAYALFCTVFSMAIAAYYAVARSGLDGHGRLLIASIAIALAIMWSTHLIWQSAGAAQLRFYLVPAAVTCVFLFPATGLLLRGWALVPMAALAAYACALAVRQRVVALASRRLLWFGAPALAALYFIWLNGSAFGHLYQFEFAQLGSLYLDNVFHAAIAEMIRNFGIASTGVDGLTPLSYHVGSHFWIAGVADMLGEPAMVVYPVALQVIAIPCFLFAFLLAVGFLPSPQAPAAKHVIVTSVACLVGSSLLIWDKLLLSESYVFSLIPFLAGMPVLFAILLDPRPGILQDKGRLGVALALAPVIFWLKIAVGVVWTVGLGYAVARSYIIGRTRFALQLLAGGVVLGFAALLALAAWYAPVPLTEMIRPFDFQRLYPTHFIADLALSLAAIAVLLADSRLPRRNRRLQVELLAVLVISSNLPGSIFALDNAAYYFVNSATWVSLVVLAARGAALLQEATARNPRARRYLFAAILATALFDPARWKSGFLLLDRVATLQAFGNGVAEVEGPYAKRGLLQAARESWQQLGDLAGSARSGKLFAANVATAVEDSPGGQFLHAVAQAKSGSPEPALVAVHPDDLAFWRMNADCRAQPMLLPALAGTPMLRGLPPAAAGCDLGVQYGYAAYGAESVAQAADRDTLCAQAARRGFRSVILLEQRGETQTSELISCP